MALWNCVCIELHFREINTIVATRGQILRLKCVKFYLGWGSTPDPLGELTALPQTPLPTSKDREGRERRKRDGEGRVEFHHILLSNLTTGFTGQFYHSCYRLCRCDQMPFLYLWLSSLLCRMFTHVFCSFVLLHIIVLVSLMLWTSQNSYNFSCHTASVTWPMIAPCLHSTARVFMCVLHAIKNFCENRILCIRMTVMKEFFLLLYCRRITEMSSWWKDGINYTLHYISDVYCFSSHYSR